MNKVLALAASLLLTTSAFAVDTTDSKKAEAAAAKADAAAATATDAAAEAKDAAADAKK